MKYSFGILLAAGLLILNGCYYDNEAELYPGYSNQPCDTVDVSYRAVVAPIIDAECNRCHSSLEARGGIVLDSHTELINKIDNGTFLETVKHLPGVSPMPKNGAKLSSCRIMQLEAWVNQGAKNN